MSPIWPSEHAASTRLEDNPPDDAGAAMPNADFQAPSYLRLPSAGGEHFAHAGRIAGTRALSMKHVFCPA
jgi:hypothetical protein